MLVPPPCRHAAVMTNVRQQPQSTLGTAKALARSAGLTQQMFESLQGD